MALVHYRNIIDSFKARRLSDAEIEKRLSDLMLLFDFSASLNQISALPDIADLLLLTIMGFTASRRAVFLLQTRKGLELVESKGHRSRLSQKEWKYFFAPPYPDYSLQSRPESPEWGKLHEALEIALLVPVHQDNRLLALAGFGGKSGSRSYSSQELQIVASLVQMCAGVLENSQTHQTLQSLNRQLTLKIYQLNTLFELSKDFNAVWDSEAIFRILGSSLIGQLLISRCAVFSLVNGAPELRFARGFRLGPEQIDCIRNLDLPALFSAKEGPVFSPSLEENQLKDICLINKLHLIYPMKLNEEIRAILFLGEKKNRKSFGQEDYDFITTLSNLALVADENARMQRAMIEKERMERELAIARDIQVSLLPHQTPEIGGYEVTSLFRPCYSVAGDYFDFLPLSPHEVAIAIGDVSGKSTPAALIMSSLQASLRALTSMAVTDPVVTIQKLNRLLCESRSNKYVTFFYGILNHRTHEFSYVNAGHCYPLVTKRNGRVDRLDIGGTVLGFFKDAAYRGGAYSLDPGDTLIFYTDGVSELINSEEVEFGVEGIVRIMQSHQDEPVDVMRNALLSALEEHRQEQHPGDDITFVLLKRLQCPEPD